MPHAIFSNPPPNLPPEEVVALARRHYGISGSAVAFVGERDQNALISVVNGANLFLKISNVAEQRGELEVQEAALRHIWAADNALPVPRIVPNLEGDAVTEYRCANGSAHFVRALTVLDGSPLAKLLKTEQLMRHYGQSLGRLSTALEGFFDDRLVKPEFLWNLDNCAIAFEWIPDISSAKLQESVQAFVNKYQSTQPLLDRCRQSVLYQDANDHNILVCPKKPHRISGIIDFGDMVFGRTVNEIAIAMAYAGMEQEQPLNTMTRLLRGYVETFPLQEQEVDRLLDQVKARLAQSICISAHRQRQFPDNCYLSVSRRPAERLFSQLQDYGSQQCLALFRVAANVGRFRLSRCDNG